MSADVQLTPDTPVQAGSRVRARQVSLVVALLWVSQSWLGVVWPWATHAPSRLVWSFLGGAISGIPLVAFIVVTLVRPEVTRRAYWFLPLYFIARGMGSIISTGGLVLSEGDRELGGFLPLIAQQALPHLVLGIALLLFRPRVSIDER